MSIKPDSTDVAENIKPVYKMSVRKRTILNFRTQTLVPKKVFLQTEEDVLHKSKKTGTKPKMVYKRIPPHLTYIGDTIDQGATRLGGL